MGAEVPRPASARLAYSRDSSRRHTRRRELIFAIWVARASAHKSLVRLISGRTRDPVLATEKFLQQVEQAQARPELEEPR